MKRKILNILVALAVVLGLSMIPAIAIGNGVTSTYAGYRLGTSSITNCTATWSTTQNYTGPYSAKLHHSTDGTGSVYVDFVLGGTITLADFQADITDGTPEWSFMHWLENNGLTNGPQFELRFTDPESTGWLEVTAVGLQGSTGTEDWVKETLIDTTPAGFGGNTPDGSSVFEWGPLTALGDIEEAVNTAWAAAETGTSASSYVLTRVRVELYEDIAQDCYIDTVTIADTTYDIEPMVLDDAYYKTNDTVIVSVFNGNNDPLAIDTLTIAAKSTTDTVGDTSITLVETGAATGIFQGAINLIGTPPADRNLDQIVVSAGGTVKVQYAGDWGAGSQTLTFDDPPLATVDGTAPTITIVSPTTTQNITNAKPEIKANYSDGSGSGIDTTTAVMKVDGITVAATAAADNIAYTPSTNMTDGTHTVTVNVSDKVGNAAIQKSWTFTVDTLDPVITAQAATPALVTPDVQTLVTFTATVNDASSGINTVKIDLSGIGSGLASDKAMLDNGVAPDVTAGDHIYTTSANVTEDTEDTYLLPVTATDYAGKTATKNISVIVSIDSTPPVITDPALAYPAGFSSARPDDDVTISVNVVDDVGMETGSVTADSDAFAAVDLLDDGNAPDVTAGDNIYTGTVEVAAGATADDYTITITATDSKGNESTDESLTLIVRATITSYEIELIEGWNLISSPLIPNDSDIDVILADISDNVSVVWAYVYDAQGDATWKVWGSGPATLTEIVDGQGYWIEMTTDNTLTISGVELPAPPDAPPAYNVYAGWNLVGFKSVDAMAADDYFGAAVVANIVRMYGYNAAGAFYTTVLTTDTLQPGHGYWLAVSDDGTIYP